MNKGFINEQIKVLKGCAFDTGYYQATLEKIGDQLSDEEVKEYDRLNSEEIARREDAHNAILKEMGAI